MKKILLVITALFLATTLQAKEPFPLTDEEYSTQQYYYHNAVLTAPRTLIDFRSPISAMDVFSFGIKLESHLRSDILENHARVIGLETETEFLQKDITKKGSQIHMMNNHIQRVEEQAATNFWLGVIVSAALAWLI